MIPAQVPYRTEVLYMARHYYVLNIEGRTAELISDRKVKKFADIDDLEPITEVNNTLESMKAYRQPLLDYLKANPDESTKLIARKFNISLPTVNVFKRQLGLTKIKKAKVLSDFNEGQQLLIKDASLTVPYVAKQLGESKFTVQRIRKKLGVRYCKRTLGDLEV